MAKYRIPLPATASRPLKRFYAARKYRVHLCRGVTVSRDTQLEGRSVIGKDSDIADSRIGLATYVAPGSRVNRARVGRFCSIGRGVQIGAGLHPVRGFVSTHPAFFSTSEQAGFTFVHRCLFDEHIVVAKEPLSGVGYSVDIGNDVWIGDRATILDGVRVGDGAVVGLGAVVTHDLPPYSINAGNPAKIIGYRFDEGQIAFLLAFKWWDRDIEWLAENAEYFSDIARMIDRFGREASGD